MTRSRHVPVTLLVCASLALAVGLTGCLPPFPGTSAPQKEAPAVEAGSDSAATSDFAVGDAVAAKWDDGNLWLANVTGVEGANVTVRYVDDGTSKTIPAADVHAIESKTWAAGDRVLAVWASGRFYPGEITAVKGGSYTVKWDDGSPESDVEAGKIIDE